MKIIFNLFCETTWGEEVYLESPIFQEKPDSVTSSPNTKMEYTEHFIWTKEIEIETEKNPHFEYSYFILNEKGAKKGDGIKKRKFSLDRRYIKKKDFVVVIKDRWVNQRDYSSLFYTSFFKEVVLKKDLFKTENKIRRPVKLRDSHRLIKFNVYTPWLKENSEVFITGNNEIFGNWDVMKSLRMNMAGDGVWSIDVVFDSNISLDYKFIIKDKAIDSIIWEEGPNRHIDIDRGDIVVVNDNVFRYSKLWRGAGICIPVFSIRTERGLGTGEFTDLKLLADWAEKVGFKVIQILPVNDTTRQYGWMDGYPYSCISVFALHPLYLNLEEMGHMPENLKVELSHLRNELNRERFLDYEKVMKIKMELSKKIFELDNLEFLETEEFRKFFEENAFWLKSYALYCTLRDKFKTADFRRWKGYETIDEKDIDRLVAKGSTFYRDVCYYYFLQFYLHKQLFEASKYAKERGVALKGDIPIGVHEESHDVWVNPELFNLDRSAGAPPDAFSEHGQNWGFPTYNWEKIKEEDYLWWRNRLKKMSQYFQLVRLDHILGFFRIWEIPKGMYSGMMGIFNPALPVTEEEIKREGLEDISRLSEPYITDQILQDIFGVWSNYVKEVFLTETGKDRFRLKQGLENQEKIDMFLSSLKEEDLPVEKWVLKEGLFRLISNLILLRDRKEKGFHFRFNMMDTPSFKSLEKWQQDKLTEMYYDYFYKRQDELWRKSAMSKLPVLKEASEMLICGEDLGMIPACVEPVMEELCILGLRIQRMPRQANEEFAEPQKYPYITVCMTSTHDMPTLRGWWQEDRERTIRFYRYALNHTDDPPEECTEEIVKEIVFHHLKSPSILAIFPVQDLLAMSENLKYRGNLSDEQINNPADPYHRWRYRMHITVEELLKQEAFMDEIKNMLKITDRI